MSPLSMRRGPHPAAVIMTVALTSALVVGAQFAWAGASPASDRAQAKKALLVLADLPKGWHQEKGSGGSSSGNFPGASQLAGCIGVPASLIASNPPEADGPYFENKSGSLEVQDSVSVFPSATRARSELAAMANTKTPGCMATIMNGAFKAKIAKSAGKGTKLGTITVTRADPANFGSGTTGLVMALPISKQGVSLTATITAVYSIKGKFGQQIDFNSYGTPFPPATSRAVTAAATHHL
jgi:hypothetical protein